MSSFATFIHHSCKVRFAATATLAAATGLLSVSAACPQASAAAKHPAANPPAAKDRVRSVSPLIKLESPHAVAGQTLTLKASLSYNNQPLKGRTLRFQVRYFNTARTPWQSAGSAQTDDKGTASVTVTVPANSVPDKRTKGMGSVQVSFGGDVTADNGLLYRSAPSYPRSFYIVAPDNGGGSGGATSGGSAAPPPPETPPAQNPPDTPPAAPPAEPAPPAAAPPATESGGGSSTGNGGTPAAGAGGAVEAAIIGPASQPLMDELRKQLGVIAATDMVQDSHLSEPVASNAIALSIEPGEAKPRRFWLEMRVDEFSVTPKDNVISTIYKSHAKVTATLSDTVFGSRTLLETKPFDESDNRFDMSGITQAIDKHTGQVTNDPRLRDVVTQKLLTLPKSGKALRQAIAQLAQLAQGAVKNAQWAKRIANVEEGEYYVAGGGASVGEKLQVVRMVSLGDSGAEPRPKGVLEVKEVTKSGVMIAKLISGAAGKNDVVMKAEPSTTSAATVAAAPPDAVHLISTPSSGTKP